MTARKLAEGWRRHRPASGTSPVQEQLSYAIFFDFMILHLSCPTCAETGFTCLYTMLYTLLQRRAEAARRGGNGSDMNHYAAKPKMRVAQSHMR